MQLRRADVLAGALELLDAEGLDGLTTRKLAASLNVQPGALYWHFPNKQALLEAMADAIVAGLGDPLPAGPWDAQATALALRLRAALLAHRDGARVVAGTFVVEPNTHLAGKRAIEILTGAGIPVIQAGWIAFALSHYVFGHTIEEQARGQLTDEETAAKLAAAENKDPELSQILRSVMNDDPDARFAYGIRLLIDGVRAQIPAPG